MLPAYPWSERPSSLPLTADEVCAALAQAHGSIPRAAAHLLVGTLVLRRFVERSARARAVIREMDNNLADRAKDKLAEALDDPDHRRVDWAIRFILNAPMARHLGFAPDPSSQLNSPQNQPSITTNLILANWGDGTPITPPRALSHDPSVTPNAPQPEPPILDLAPNPPHQPPQPPPKNE
jgi:hypothetical protein